MEPELVPAHTPVQRTSSIITVTDDDNSIRHMNSFDGAAPFWDGKPQERCGEGNDLML